MFKMSFRRILYFDWSSPFSSYIRYPTPPSTDFFYIDIIESKNSSFIIYGDYSNKSLKLKFKKFSNLKDMRRTTIGMVEEKCEEYNVDFNSLEVDERDVFVVFTPEEFKQNYLLKSWYYNNGIISNYVSDGFRNRRDFRGTTSNYSDVISYLDTVTIPSRNRIEIKPLSDLTSSIFDGLSDTDKSYLNELLKEADTEFNLTDNFGDNLTDNVTDIAKIYLQNPLFGRF